VPFEISAPQVVGVELRGRLRPWVHAKDIISSCCAAAACAAGWAASSS
jgi:aconitase A